MVKLLTPSGGRMSFDGTLPVSLWTSDFRLSGPAGRSYRGFQATPLSAIDAMVADLGGRASGQFAVSGGTLSTYDLNGPRDERENDVSGLGAGEGRAMPLTAASLGAWRGRESGVFGFFYGASSTPEHIATYFSGLEFTDDGGISVKSNVPRETLASEVLYLSVDRVGLFRVMKSTAAREMVPRAAGRRIGVAEVWKQVFETQPGQRAVAFLAATNSAVAVLSLEAPEGTDEPDATREQRAFQAIEKISRLDWN